MTSLPMDPRVQTGRLPNGLTYYLQRHQPEQRRAHVYFVVKAGSVQEEEDQRGLAHFVEHMAFNGTRRFAKQELVELLEKSGLTFGADMNAGTTYDHTRYHLSVPTDVPHLLGTALDVLEDWAQAITFMADEVEKERSVILSEWTSSQGAQRRLSEQRLALILAGSRFADRYALGNRRVLEGASPERIRDYYRRWYRPERVAVVVVGDIEPQALKNEIERRFAGWSSPDPLSDPNSNIPVRHTTSLTVLTDSETPAAIVRVLLKAPARLVRSVEDLKDQTQSQLGAAMLRHRLEALERSAEASFTDSSCSLTPSVLGRLDLFEVLAMAKQGRVQDTLERLVMELERVRRHGFTDDELARAKAERLRFFEHALAAQNTFASTQVAEPLIKHFLTGDVTPSLEQRVQFERSFVADIVAADVSRRMSRWLTESEELVIASGPERDALPSQEQLNAALVAAKSRSVEAYRDEIPNIPLMPTLPQPGRIVKEDHIAEIGVSVWTLSNGARVVLKPTDFKADEILGQAISFGGTATLPAREFGDARLAHEIVTTSGVGALDRQQLARALAGKAVTVYPWIAEQDEGIRANAAPQDLETMFQLVHLYATAPRRDEAAFEVYRAQLVNQLRNRDLHVPSAFTDAIGNALWGGDARRRVPSLGEVKAVDLNRALEFYKQRFSDVSDFSFVFVGKIDLTTFRPLVERYLASLPGGSRHETSREIGLHRKSGITKVRIKKGKEDAAALSLLYHGESPWSENAHTDLVSLQSYLAIRLREVLREELGAVYTPYVNANFERVPYDAYSLTISLDCKPSDVEKVLRATRQIIDDTKKTGAAAGYVDKIRKQRTRDLDRMYHENGFWLERLVDKYKLREDPRNILILHDLTQRVTSENIKQAARHFLREDQYLEAELQPER
ncbi:MAG TPA: insulinase family protein [Polyangiaceae bacterium]|nr:insulinase family protein [Polyangiaceae bacterium]